VARVVLARRARLALLDLDRPLRVAVDDALGLLGREPDSGYELRGRLRGLQALRIGSYRILYELEDDSRTVRVTAILHRSVPYRSDPR
jgi:mRNA interferase RelE/StbE